MNDHEELKAWLLQHMGWCPDVLTEEQAAKVREIKENNDE